MLTGLLVIVFCYNDPLNESRAMLDEELLKDIVNVMYHLQNNTMQVVNNTYYYAMLFDRLNQHDVLRDAYQKAYPLN
jgi:hypothetical protein